VGYWLMKSEPDDYSIDDLERDKMEPWDGIRNYQARNMIRDDMQIDRRPGILLSFELQSSRHRRCHENRECSLP
jgi:hypothetical protein